jgi:hypothetical protein
MSLLRGAKRGATPPVQRRVTPLVSVERAAPEIPDWALSSVLAFLEPFFRGEGPDGGGSIFTSAPPRDFVREVERSFQVPLNWHGGRSSAATDLWVAMQNDRALLVRILDFALQNLAIGYDFQSGDGAAHELARGLRQAGADYEVARLAPDSAYYRLQRRTTAAASAAVQAQEAIRGNAADHLDKAWNAAFGRDPNPGMAYSHAVKAVEAAAIPVVLPNDPVATLGKVVGQLRAAPEKYAVVFERDIRMSRDASLSPVQVVTALADTLWTNQIDRHAPGDQQPAVPIDQPQAEFAVHIALSLVQAFRSAVRAA